jgi:DNA-binding NtrC family response regulator
LYYRISTVTVSLPSLDERKEDIPYLTDYILKKLSAKLERNLSISSSAMETLMKSNWKGNVRELENTIERAAICSSSDRLDIVNFRFVTLSTSNESVIANSEDKGIKEMEKLFIQKVLEDNNWNKLKASKIIGIDRKTLYKKIREYNLQ